MRLGGGRMGERRSREFVAWQGNVPRCVGLEKNRNISIYYVEYSDLAILIMIDCDCLYRYVPSGQIRAITRTNCSGTSS